MSLSAPRLRRPRFREMRPSNQRLGLALLVAAAMVFQLTLAIRLIVALEQDTAPHAFVPTDLAGPLWLLALMAIAIGAIWLMPVSRVIRWLLTLALAVSWPFIDALAQGEVRPMGLLLALVVGWRLLAGRWAALPRRARIAAALVAIAAVVGIGAVLGLAGATQYAIVLFVPVAWLMSRGRWWAVLILAATSVPISDAMPAIVYPILFGVVLLAAAREAVA